MYSDNRKPSEVIALQRQVIDEQVEMIAILKEALAAAGLEAVPEFKPWMAGLTPQEHALLGALYHHYPNPVGKYELLEVLPGYDHVEERVAQLVCVKVNHLRKKLGADVIENVRGLGYRLGAQQHAIMRGKEPAGNASAQATVIPFRSRDRRRAA